MQVGVPVIPAPDQFDVRRWSHRTQAVVTQTTDRPVARTHDLGAKRQPTGSKLRFAARAFTTIDDPGRTLEAARTAQLQCREAGNAKDHAAHRRFLIVCVGLVLAVAHLVEETELIVDVAIDEASKRRCTDVTNVPKGAAARALLDEHRARNRFDVPGERDALVREWKELLTDIEAKRGGDGDGDGRVLENPGALVDVRVAEDGGIGRDGRALCQAEGLGGIHADTPADSR